MCPLVAAQTPSNNLHLARPDIVVGVGGWGGVYFLRKQLAACRVAEGLWGRKRERGKRVAEQSGSVSPPQGAGLLVGARRSVTPGGATP